MRTIVALAAIAVLTGCVRTSAIRLGDATPRPPIPWEQVQVFLKEADVPGAFEKIALIKAEGPSDWTTNRGMVDKVRREAAKLGANGVILEEIKEPSAGAKVAGAIFGVSAQRHGTVLAIWYNPPPR